MNKPAPMTDADIVNLLDPDKNLRRVDGWVAWAKTYVGLFNDARDAQWQEMLSKQEPVAWQHEFIGDFKRLSYTPNIADFNGEHRNDAVKITPLYASPVAQQEPVAFFDAPSASIKQIKSVPHGTMLYAAPKEQA